MPDLIQLRIGDVEIRTEKHELAARFWSAIEPMITPGTATRKQLDQYLVFMPAPIARNLINKLGRTVYGESFHGLQRGQDMYIFLVQTCISVFVENLTKVWQLTYSRRVEHDGLIIYDVDGIVTESAATDTAATPGPADPAVAA